MAQAQSLGWASVLALAAWLLVSAVRRLWPAALVATDGALVAVLPLVTLPTAVSCASGDSLGVFSLNALAGGTDIDALADHIAARDPQVVVLVEVTESMITEFQATDVGARYAYRTGPLSGGGYDGSVIVSTLPLRETGGPLVVGSFDQPAAWDARLVIAGDFNAGPAHPVFREASAGLDSAAQAAGWWVWPTWPAEGSIPAFASIDHILTRGFEPVAFERIDVSGTDHLAVAAELRVCGS